MTVHRELRRFNQNFCNTLLAILIFIYLFLSQIYNDMYSFEDGMVFWRSEIPKVCQNLTGRVRCQNDMFGSLRWFCHILLHCHSKMAAGKWFIILSNKSGMFVIFCPFSETFPGNCPILFRSPYFFSNGGRHFSKGCTYFLGCVSRHFHYGYLSCGGRHQFYLSERDKNMSVFALLV